MYSQLYLKVDTVCLKPPNKVVAGLSADATDIASQKNGFHHL